MVKNEVTSNQLPMIKRYDRKIDSSGTGIEEKEITIIGKTLDECKKRYDEIK